jgi:hypothetical protein
MVGETTNITKKYATSLADDAITLETQKEVPWMVGMMACLSHCLSLSIYIYTHTSIYIYICVCVCVRARARFFLFVYVYSFFALSTKSKCPLLAECPDHWMEKYKTQVCWCVRSIEGLSWLDYSYLVQYKPHNF